MFTFCRQNDKVYWIKALIQYLTCFYRFHLKLIQTNYVNFQHWYFYHAILQHKNLWRNLLHSIPISCNNPTGIITKSTANMFIIFFVWNKCLPLLHDWFIANIRTTNTIAKIFTKKLVFIYTNKRFNWKCIDSAVITFIMWQDITASESSISLSRHGSTLSTLLSLLFHEQIRLHYLM